MDWTQRNWPSIPSRRRDHYISQRVQTGPGTNSGTCLKFHEFVVSLKLEYQMADDVTTTCSNSLVPSKGCCLRHGRGKFIAVQEWANERFSARYKIETNLYHMHHSVSLLFFDWKRDMWLKLFQLTVLLSSFGFIFTLNCLYLICFSVTSLYIVEPIPIPPSVRIITGSILFKRHGFTWLNRCFGICFSLIKRFWHRSYFHHQAKRIRKRACSVRSLGGAAVKPWITVPCVRVPFACKHKQTQGLNSGWFS
jgi:hypothetical protein